MNYEYESELAQQKAQAEAAQEVEKAQRAYVADMAGQTMCNAEPRLAGRAYGVTASMASMESLRSRLQRRASDGAGEAAKYGRAIDILARHPEFEELIELIRMNVV